jgi:Fe2+ transport system protein FeoA
MESGKLQLPLARLKNGEHCVIVSVEASDSPGRHHRRWGLQKRLEDLGLTPGTPVTMVKSAPFHGPVEILVRGSRLALGRRMAERILVRVER